MSDSQRSHGLQPTRLLHPWDFLATVLEWGAIAFSVLLRSVITETHLGPCILARLRSQNGLDQNGFSYVKKVMLGSLSLWTLFPGSLSHGPPSYLLRVPFLWRMLIMCVQDPALMRLRCVAAAAAAAVAKSLQSCTTLCDPIDGSLPGSSSLGFSRQER